MTAKHLIVSIAAGVTLEQLEEAVGGKTRVIRVMPNTPALVGEGAAGFARGRHAKAADAKLAKQMLEAVGVAVEVPERLINAVTGLSGSGPAYGFQMIEAMSDGAVAAGLPRDLATPLAAQTLLGAAKMVLETGEHPGKLKDMVTSPGGTTIEGLHEMEAAGVRDGLMNAVRAAADKAALWIIKQKWPFPRPQRNRRRCCGSPSQPWRLLCFLRCWQRCLRRGVGAGSPVAGAITTGRGRYFGVSAESVGGFL